MDKCRLLPLSVNDAFTNMAIDESIAESVGRGESPPTLRFYRWNPSTISIGCFQKLENEVDVEKAREEGVDVVRRISGGGSVFHDYRGELTYSFVGKTKDLPSEIIKSFEKICNGLVNGFEYMGLDARYSEVNDVLVDGKKISGSAQTRRHGSVLQHGTILIDPNVRLMFELLKVPAEKITDKFVSSVYENVTSLARELEEKPSFDEVRENMIKGFEHEFDENIFEGELSGQEKSGIEGLRKKYASDEWTRKR